jgi:hypothetical protein
MMEGPAGLETVSQKFPFVAGFQRGKGCLIRDVPAVQIGHPARSTILWPARRSAAESRLAYAVNAMALEVKALAKDRRITALFHEKRLWAFYAKCLVSMES